MREHHQPVGAADRSWRSLTELVVSFVGGDFVSVAENGKWESCPNLQMSAHQLWLDRASFLSSVWRALGTAMGLVLLALATTALSTATLVQTRGESSSTHSSRRHLLVLKGGKGGNRLDDINLQLSYYADHDHVEGGPDEDMRLFAIDQDQKRTIVQGFEDAFDYFHARRPPAPRCWRGFSAAVQAHTRGGGGL